MYYIGVDVGGTGMKAGVTDALGNIIKKAECRTYVELGYKRIIDDMAKLIFHTIELAKLSTGDIKTIGIGIPGVADLNGNIYYATNLKWSNVPLGDLLREYFPGITIYVQNDATVAALAELHTGSMKGVKSGIMLTLGTGVGGGIIIDEKVFSGAHGIGSEMGHMIIGENFYDCNCGNNGCLETFCSATAIIKYAQKLISEGRKTSVTGRANEKPENITAKMVFDSYLEGDELSKEVIERFVRYLGIGIASLVNAFDPEIFCLGGGVARAFDIFRDDLKIQTDKRVIFKNIPYGSIVPAVLGNDAGVVGAAMLGL